MFEPISKTRISESAVEQIKTYIIKQKLEPGEKLPSEREMSDSLNISRASVREALRTLEIMGVIEVKPGSGIYFKDWTGDLSIPLTNWIPYNKETLYDNYEVRQLIEPRAAAIAAERATPEILEKMHTCMEKFRKAYKADNLPGMILADTEFHRTLAEATQNKTLSFLMNTITRFLPEGWKASLRVPARPEKTINEHQKIYEAIKNHQGKVASEAMALHLTNAIFEIEQVEDGDGKVDNP